jgi:hypothetical protein
VLRQAAVKVRQTRRPEADGDLEDLHLVTQLFSYPADYLAERPTLERLAETLDKFEEDVLGVAHATPRGTRRAVVSFGDPVEVSAERSKGAATALTKLLEQRVQAMLDEIGSRPLPGEKEFGKEAVPGPAGGPI